jgi:hypothetical protein
MTPIHVVDRRGAVIGLRRCSLVAPVTEGCFAEHPLVIKRFHPT